MAAGRLMGALVRQGGKIVKRASSRGVRMTGQKAIAAARPKGGALASTRVRSTQKAAGMAGKRLSKGAQLGRAVRANAGKIAVGAAAAGGGVAAYKNRGAIKAKASAAKTRVKAGVAVAKREASYVGAGAKNVYQSGKARTIAGQKYGAAKSKVSAGVGRAKSAAGTAKRKVQAGYKMVYGKLQRVRSGG